MLQESKAKNYNQCGPEKSPGLYEEKKICRILKNSLKLGYGKGDACLPKDEEKQALEINVETWRKEDVLQTWRNMIKEASWAQWYTIRHAKWARFWMALNARPGNAVADDVWRTLILSEYFHLFSILDVIFCVKLQQLPTHSLQFPLQTLVLYIYLFKLRDQGKETLIINPLATKQISNLKIKIYYQNGLYFSNPIYKVLKFSNSIYLLIY